MKKGLLTLALVAGSLLSAQAQSAAPVKAIVKPGQTQKLAIQLQNPEGVDYTALEMDITLPEGLTFAGGDDAVVVKRASKGSAPHKAFYNEVDGKLKIVVFSAESYEANATITAGNENFDGTSGDLVLINVVPAETLPEDFSYKGVQVSVSNSGTAQVGKARFVSKTTENVFEEVTLDAYVAGLLGDVDGSNDITGYDASLILQNAAGIIAADAAGYENEAADVDESSNISGYDASLVLQYAAGIIKNF